jgi:hypothetical protein
MSRIRIESNGAGFGTRVLVDGKELTDVVAVVWRCKDGEFATARITLVDVDVDVSAEVGS